MNLKPNSSIYIPNTVHWKDQLLDKPQAKQQKQ